MAKFKQEYIYGIHTLIEAINQEKEIDKVLIRQGNKGELFQRLFNLIREKNIPFQFVPEAMFKSFSDKNHQGVLAEIAPIPYSDINEVLDSVEATGKVPFVLVLDRITDVRNFGAIARSASCSGVDLIIIPTKNSVKISSDAIKTSAGALYHIPVAKVPNLKKVVREMKFQRGMMIYAASEKSEKIYTEVPMTDPLVLIMGSEDKGIEEGLLNVAVESIKIPQVGEMDSLNVSAAATVLMYEAFRQRGFKA